jgi:phenylacetate-CoA ligase
MTIQKWSLKEIVEYARENSLFYKEIYDSVEFNKISDLPIIDQQKFWKTTVITSDSPDGIVFKSGGSTGAPKYSYFTSLEWQSFTEAFGWGISQGIVENGDRLANLFYVGDLYASFIFINDSLMWIGPNSKKITQFPIAGATDPKSILKTIAEFNINVLVGVPSAILTLLELYGHQKENYPQIKIEKILFGGESLYADQLDAYKKILPDVSIASVGYASVDAGLLGYSSRDCSIGEHRTFDRANIIEIVDPDTYEVIEETNRVGKVLVTNLTRKLMPIIRYPAGDMAMWIEPPDVPYRKFKLMGRSDEAARVGTISVYFEDTRALVMKSLKEITGLQFQMIITHFNGLDQLTLKIAAHNLMGDIRIAERVIDAFKRDKPVYLDVLQKKLIHPLKIEIVDMKEMEVNSRTGKLKRVIDRRLNS